MHAKGALATLLATSLLLGAGCAAAHPTTAPRHHVGAASNNITTANSSTAGSAGSGTSANGTGSSPTPTIVDVGQVNGCDAAQGMFDLCWVGPPVWMQGSPAYESWSHVVVGETVNLHGAVRMLSNGEPEFQDVYVEAPSGTSTEIPVGNDGGFSQEYTFKEQGEYTLGTGTPSQQNAGVQFSVVYQPVPPAGSLLSDVFPGALQPWPGLTVIGVPFGQKGSVRVRFVDAAGNPARNATLDAMQPVETNADGYATLPYDTTQVEWPLRYIYGSLFFQTVLHVTVNDGKVTGLFPQEPDAQPVGVPAHEVGGTWLADAQDFLANVSLTPHQTGDFLTLTDAVDTTQVITLNLQTGAVTTSGIPGATQAISVHPVTINGRAYLSLGDLAKLVNLVAWAKVLPDGSLLLSEHMMP